ncbi:hypothetical protein KAF25_002045 [Fusarium avenaceum]|uniref:Uncharacterized protein n=1 Tax=Fusarium avenaceum TaxID=40199 RepID=A0A9P7KN98_9HYPO|nr:hypothetical protein KAF25_002045 [Fusarium avenaceum]
MSTRPETPSNYRLACPLLPFPSASTSIPKACLSGEVNMSHLRVHIRAKHLCDCKQSCERATHFPPDTIDFILAVRKKDGQLDGPVWTEMHRRAYPDAVEIPAPYLPTVVQALAVARSPTQYFMQRSVLAFARQGNLGQQQAIRDLRTVLKYLPVFFDVLSRVGPFPNAQPNSSAPLRDQAVSALARPAVDNVTLRIPTVEADNSADGIYMLDEQEMDLGEHLNHFDMEWANHFGNSS